MKPSILAALAVVTVLAASPASAQTKAADAGPLCSPAVSTVLGAWDAGMATAEKFGEKATALAREKGRELLLPLLGIDPKTVSGQTGRDDATGDVAREVEASRSNPERRAALCAAVTQAVGEARDKAGAGLDALKRAVDSLAPALPGQEPARKPEIPPKDGLIRT